MLLQTLSSRDNQQRREGTERPLDLSMGKDPRSHQSNLILHTGGILQHCSRQSLSLWLKHLQGQEAKGSLFHVCKSVYEKAPNLPLFNSYPLDTKKKKPPNNSFSNIRSRSSGSPKSFSFFTLNNSSSSCPSHTKLDTVILREESFFLFLKGHQNQFDSVCLRSRYR